MRIAIGADHRGSHAAERIAERVKRQERELVMLQACDDTPCDYPERAWTIANAIVRGDADRGILICGTGIGMSIAANKVKGIRAAVVHDELTAQLSRSHNDANILCLSADLLGERLIESIVDIWLTTPFEGGRHARRIHKIEAIERDEDPSSITE